MQSAEYDAVVAAIDEFSRAACLLDLGIYTPEEDAAADKRHADAHAAILKAIDAWATARDAAISAEVYEDAAKIADRFAHDSGARVIAGEIRTRAQPVPAPKHGKGGAERAGDEVMQSREAMLQKLDAERAKETGDE